MFYNARWYDPMTGRMAQADTIVPGGVQGLDRYAYVNNSPVVYTDPSGHCTDPTDYACRQSADMADAVIYAGLQVTPLYQTKLGYPYPESNTYCGEVAFTMAYNSVYDPDLVVQSVVEYADANKLHTGGYPYTSPANMVELAASYVDRNYLITGNVSVTNPNEGLQLLFSQLQDMNSVIVDIVTPVKMQSGSWDKLGGDSHFVTVTAIVTINGITTVFYNDPLTGQTSAPWDVFYRAWTTNGDTDGTGNGWYLIIDPPDPYEEWDDQPWH